MRFRKGLSIVLTAAMTAGLAGCGAAGDTAATTAGQTAAQQTTGTHASAGSSTDMTFADTISWNAEYDVVIAGFGGAGAVAATTAADIGATVLLVEKAPEGHEGGNTRYSSQRFLYTEDVESTKTYLKAVRGLYTNMSDEIVDYLAEGFSTTLGWYKANGGFVAEPKVEPEYPDLEGADSMQKVYTVSGENDSRFWNVLRNNVVETHKDTVDVWYEAPAMKLIQDPVSKTVIGVEVEKDGQTLNVRANNGVILATGGFENNQKMIQDYLQKPYAAPLGSTYNTGDGVQMGIDVGANLWHMSALSGPFLEFVNPESGHGFRQLMGKTGTVKDSSAIIVGADGTRFVNETYTPKHGHIPFHGMFIDMPISFPLFLIFDQKQMDTAPMYKIWSKDGSVELEKGWITKGETLAELAEKVGLPADGLEKGVSEYNAVCATGEDPLGRPAEFLHAIGDGPYYAVELTPSFINTQGGPERNTNCEILDTAGNPIPHLYSAGELGSFYGSLYQGAGNLAECIVSGRTAGENAAAAKEALPALTFAKAEAGQQYEAQTETEAVTAIEGEYIANVIGMAPMTLKITSADGKITAIDVVRSDETVGIGDVATEKMIATIMEAQNTDVDTIAGATLTSNAIIKAVNEAMEAEGITAAPEETTATAELAADEYMVKAKGLEEMTLKVRITDGKIEAIDVVAQNETKNIGGEAFPVIIDSIISSQSTDVDGVSGATLTCDAVKDAVNQALEQAK